MRIVGLVFEDPAKHVCPVCGREYKSEAYLEKHIEKEHSAPAAPPNLPPVTGNGDDEDA